LLHDAGDAAPQDERQFVGDEEAIVPAVGVVWEHYNDMSDIRSFDTEWVANGHAPCVAVTLTRTSPTVGEGIGRSPRRTGLPTSWTKIAFCISGGILRRGVAVRVEEVVW
jgi:hypothetical protein